MLLSIHHTTEYQFDKPVRYALQRLKLRPKNGAGQTIHDWQLEVSGGKVEAEHDDPHNNHVTLISIEEGRTAITISCRGQVDTADNHGILGKHRSFVPLWAYCRPTRLTTAGRGVQKLLAGIDRTVEDKIAMLHELSAHILSSVEYRTGQTGVDTNAEQAIGAGAGVCQDHAHIFISACRAMNVPARYVSGYLMMDGQIEQTASERYQPRRPLCPRCHRLRLSRRRAGSRHVIWRKRQKHGCQSARRAIGYADSGRGPLG
jgi:transglutaminase-like putative cysteine protease